MHKADITAAVAAGLVAEQFPQWADLSVVPVALDGWDNTTFRLGDEMSVRLPSADAYVAQVGKEHRWLPVLGPSLPLRIPEPLAMGEPGGEFPRPWSIYRWLDGDPASVDRVTDPTAFAADLGDFLIEVLADEIDRDDVTEVWEAALASTCERSPVWVHGDVSPSNLLVVDGRLRAVIDFGCAGVGDPACDLVMAWTFFTDDSRREFRARLMLDDATWARGRGWALWKALITLAREKQGGENADDAARRFGWRGGPREVIDRVLADA